MIWPLNYIFYFILKKIQNKNLKIKKTKKKKKVATLGHQGGGFAPNGYQGWLDHPHGAKGVAETTPKQGLVCPNTYHTSN
jgi:hypothetical protein